jgi:hypothetical protein
VRACTGAVSDEVDIGQIGGELEVSSGAARATDRSA